MFGGNTGNPERVRPIEVSNERAYELFMLIVTVTLPPEAVALEHTLREVPELVVEAERIAAHSTNWTMPCLWMASPDFENVDAVLADDPTVHEVKETHEFVQEKYYNIEWSDDVISRVDAYVDEEASILEARASDGRWRMRIRFVSRKQFACFRDYLEEQRYSFQVLDFTEPRAPRQSVGELTTNQRDALAIAFERGYYDVPRAITARDLAEELDMSHQSLSELLRRGAANLIRSTLITDGESRAT